MKIYMAVTADEYELPVAIADNVGQLAKMYDMYPCNVCRAIQKHSTCQGLRIRFVKIEIDEE